MGQQIAARDVTVVDDGTLPGRRGSISIDDEGTPSRRTVLIENGKLVGYMQDRLQCPTDGSGGDRQRPAPVLCPPAAAAHDQHHHARGRQEPGGILASVQSGLYAVSFGGGQVDITSGKFVFSCTEAYRIENGKIGAPSRERP